MAFFDSLYFLKPLLIFVDIFLVYLLVYNLLVLLKGTHAFDLIKGLFLLFLLFFVSALFDLVTIRWMIEKFTAVSLILVVVIFQPELRRFLKKIGSRGDFFSQGRSLTDTQTTLVVKHITRAIDALSKDNIGAIIAIEQETLLESYVTDSLIIDGNLSSELLCSLFWPTSPTHDGAVIIRKNRIYCANCFLPLTHSELSDRRLGTRHRAAIGLSEQTDAFVIVISEDKGVISIIEDGIITRFLNKETIESRLFTIFNRINKKPLPKFTRTYTIFLKIF